MKKFKKVLLIVFGLILMMSTLPRDVGAASENSKHKKIIFQQEEIKDMDVLYEKAKKDKEDKKNQNFKHKALLKGQSKSVEVDTISTSQLLEVAEVNGVREEYYAVTTFAAPSSEDLLSASSTTASKSDYKYDGSYSVRLNSTFYYTNTTTAGVAAVKYHHAEASYTILDSTVSITKAEMWLGASGWSSGGGVTQVTGKYVLVDYRSVYPPSSWVPIANDSTKNFGVNSKAYLKRGTSTWSFELINQL